MSFSVKLGQNKQFFNLSLVSMATAVKGRHCFTLILMTLTFLKVIHTTPEFVALLGLAIYQI